MQAPWLHRVPLYAYANSEWCQKRCRMLLSVSDQVTVAGVRIPALRISVLRGHTDYLGLLMEELHRL